MRVVQVGDRGVDFASMPDPDGWPGIVRKGARFGFRYCAGTTSTGSGAWKVCRPDEIAQIVAAGADFIGNFEVSESTPTEGRASGARHGAADREFWQSRGLAPGAGVTVSWEPGNDKSQWPAVAGFLEGYKAAIGRPIGMYAGLPTLLHFRKLGLLDCTHLPMSTAASGLPSVPDSEKPALLEKAGRDNGIHFVQNFRRWYGQGADEDIYTCPLDVPFTHLQALNPEDDMPTADEVAQAVARYKITDDGQTIATALRRVDDVQAAVKALRADVGALKAAVGKIGTPEAAPIDPAVLRKALADVLDRLDIVLQPKAAT